MKAQEIDTAQAKDLADREMLEKIFSALVTAEPTPLNPDPPPGTIERVEQIANQLAAVQVEQEHVASELADHREAVRVALAADHRDVKDLLEQHAESDERNFSAIRETLQSLDRRHRI